MSSNLLRRYSTWITHEHLVLVSLTACMFGLFYSRALVSIVSVGIVGLGMIHRSINGWDRRSVWNAMTGPFIIIFLLYVVSGLLMSDDVSSGLHRIKMNLYYVTLPLGLSMLGTRSATFWARVLMSFVLVCTITTMPLLWEWISNGEAIAERYNVGKTIETPVIHIRYSFLLVLGTLVAWHFLVEWPSSVMKWGRYRWMVLLPIALYLTAGLHVLAVRTGLVALYAGLLMYAWVMLLKRLGVLRTSILTVALLGMLVLAGRTVPTIKNKIAYSRYDLQEFFAGRHNHLFSDHMRLMTIHIGWEALNDHPWMGVGVGDLELATADYFERLYPAVPKESFFTPINQYGHTFMAFGYIGGAIFFVSLLWLLTLSDLRQDGLVLLIYAAVFAAFIGDALLELQIGKNAVLIVLLSSTWHAIALKHDSRASS